MNSKTLLILSIVLVTGCASSYQRLQPVRTYLYQHQYQKAVEVFDSLDITEQNAVSLDHANRGLLLHLNGDYTESNAELEIAETYMDRIREENLKQIISSMLINEYSLPYAGEDYENTMVNFYKLFNYVLLNDFQEALVECRRIDHKLNVLYDFYSENLTYREDGFARYLAGIIYEHLGQYDDAFIEYYKSYHIYRELYSSHYNLNPPQGLISSLIKTAVVTSRTDQIQDLLSDPSYQSVHSYIQIFEDSLNHPPDSQCEIIYILEAGELPHKQEINVYLDIDEDHPQPVAISLPTIVPHPSAVTSGHLNSGIHQAPLELVENLGAIAALSLEDHRGRIIVRAAARTGLKILASEAGEFIGDQITDEENSWLGDLIGSAISIFGAATEHADLRSWSLLPDRIFLGRLTIDPNQTSFTVNLHLSGYSDIVLTYSINPKPGEKIFIKDRLWY